MICLVVKHGFILPISTVRVSFEKFRSLPSSQLQDEGEGDSQDEGDGEEEMPGGQCGSNTQCYTSVKSHFMQIYQDGELPLIW